MNACKDPMQFSSWLLTGRFQQPALRYKDVSPLFIFSKGIQ